VLFQILFLKSKGNLHGFIALLFQAQCCWFRSTLCLCKIKPNRVKHVPGRASVLNQTWSDFRIMFWILCNTLMNLIYFRSKVLTLMIAEEECCSKIIWSRNRMSYWCKSHTHCSFWSNGSPFGKDPGETLGSTFTLQQRWGTLKLSQTLIIRPRSSSSQLAVNATEACTPSNDLRSLSELGCALLTSLLCVQENWGIMRRGGDSLLGFVSHVSDWRQDDYQKCWGG